MDAQIRKALSALATNERDRRTRDDEFLKADRASLLKRYKLQQRPELKERVSVAKAIDKITDDLEISRLMRQNPDVVAEIVYDEVSKAMMKDEEQRRRMPPVPVEASVPEDEDIIAAIVSRFENVASTKQGANTRRINAEFRDVPQALRREASRRLTEVANLAALEAAAEEARLEAEAAATMAAAVARDKAAAKAAPASAPRNYKAALLSPAGATPAR